MISLATVLDELDLSDEDERRDRVLQRMIEAATALLGRKLRRYLGTPAETIETFAGGRRLILLDDPIGDVAVRGRTYSTDPWDDVATTDYSLSGRRLRYGSGSRWPGLDEAVEVTYTRGYEIDEGPADLREIILDMVTEKWNGSQESVFLKSESIGDYSYSNFTDAELASSALAFGDWESFARAHRRALV